MARGGVLYEKDLNNVNEMQRQLSEKQAPTQVKFMHLWAFTKGIFFEVEWINFQL